MLKRMQDYTARSAINSTANCLEQASYQKTQRRRTKADGYHLYPALTPVSDQGPRRINSHGEERHCAQCYRQANSWRARDDHEWNNRYEVTDEGRHCDNHRALHQAPLGHRLKMQFFIHHRAHPGFTIGCYCGNNIFEKLSLEALGRIDLSDFQALVLGLCCDFFLLARSLS